MKAEYLDIIPDKLKDGIIYISKKYGTAIHLCACGCKRQSVTPLGMDEWTLTDNEGKITLTPSIGNWSGENPYHAHYFITNGEIKWS